MSSVALIIGALMSTSCSANNVGLVRSKGTRTSYQVAGEVHMNGKTISNFAQDGIGRIAMEGKAGATKLDFSAAISASSVPTVHSRSDTEGPSFDSHDHHDDYPIITHKVDSTAQRERAKQSSGLAEEEESGSSIPMFLFMACGGAVIGWVYMTAQSRKDKASALSGMFAPLVQDAMGAIGIASKWQSSYQRVGKDDRMDDLMDDDHDAGAKDRSLGEQPMNVDLPAAVDVDDEPEQAPALIPQISASDLLAADDEPDTLDSLGLLDTDSLSFTEGF